MMLKDKVTIVTGGGQGIGRGIVEAVAREGAKVVVVTRREVSCKPVADEINAKGGTAAWFVGDASKPEDVKAMVDFTVEKFGHLDCAVNNAGKLGTPEDVADMPVEHLDSVMNLDLRGTFLCCQEELLAMHETGSGSIVNIASISSLHGDRGLSSYNMAKHAVLGLTRAAALEEAKKGVRINAVLPGVVRTPLQDKFKAEDPEGFEKQLAKSNIPMGRLAEPEEIGNTVAFLLSDLSSYTTGAGFVVDGGVTAQ
jgi:NAD(P)-dependent dehydrogenase (short-subunit alcohol dehydrogenase family)